MPSRGGLLAATVVLLGNTFYRRAIRKVKLKLLIPNWEIGDCASGGQELIKERTVGDCWSLTGGCIVWRTIDLLIPLHPLGALLEGLELVWHVKNTLK
jgi:hypothetical protein